MGLRGKDDSQKHTMKQYLKNNEAKCLQDLSVSQSLTVSQSVLRPISQPVNQSVRPSANQSVCPSTDNQSVSPSVSRLIS